MMPKLAHSVTPLADQTGRAESDEVSAQGLAQVTPAEEGRDAEQSAFMRKVGQWEGRDQLLDVSQKILGVSRILEILEFKKTKKYKGLRHLDQDGRFVTLRNWADFCRVVLDRSVEQVDEDIRNFKAFGDALMSALRRMSISSRQMRDMRLLPAAELAMISEAAKTGDADLVKQAAEDAIERMRYDREDSDAKQAKNLADLEKNITIKDRRLNEVSQALEQAKDDLERRALSTPDEFEAAQLAGIAGTGPAADVAVRQLLITVAEVLQKPATEAAETAARNAVVYVCQVMAGQVAKLGIDVEFTEMITPHWLAGVITTPAKDA